MKLPSKNELSVDAIFQGILLVPALIFYIFGLANFGSSFFIFGIIFQLLSFSFQTLSCLIRIFRQYNGNFVEHVDKDLTTLVAKGADDAVIEKISLQHKKRIKKYIK